MFKLALLLLIAGLTMLSDWGIDHHHGVVEKLVQAGQLEKTVMAYEKPELIHGFHYAEKWCIAGLFLIGLVAMYPPARVFEIAPMLWGAGLLALTLMAGTAMLFQGISDGAEGQFNAHLSFWDSNLPLIIEEFTSGFCAMGLLIFGPPKGWDGDGSLMW